MYLTAADLVETLYRGLADNTVGRTIEALLHHDLLLVDLCRHRDYARGAGGGRQRDGPSILARSG